MCSLIILSRVQITLFSEPRGVQLYSDPINASEAGHPQCGAIPERSCFPDLLVQLVGNSRAESVGYGDVCSSSWSTREGGRQAAVGCTAHLDSEIRKRLRCAVVFT
jgi:hypothetical protein